MAIKYPGQTLQQYGQATVIQMGKADAAQKTAIATVQQQQKSRAAALKARKALEKDMFKDIKVDGVRAADAPYINSEFDNLRQYYQDNRELYNLGDRNVIGTFNSMQSELLNKTIASKEERKNEDIQRQSRMNEGYNTDYNNLNLNKKIQTSMFGSDAETWNGTEEAPGIGSFRMYPDIDFGEYYKDFKVNEQFINKVEGVDMGTAAVAGYNIDFEPSTKALIAQGSSAYSQFKDNPGAVVKFKQTYDNETFLNNIPTQIKNLYSQAKKDGDMDGMMTALSAGQVYLATDNKDIFKLTSLPLGQLGPSIDESTDGNYFVGGRESSVSSYYLPINSRRGIGLGRGVAGSIDLDFNDVDDQMKLSKFFGYSGDNAWSEWTRDAGYKDVGEHGVMGVRQYNRISFNLPKGAEGAQNLLNLSNVPYTRISFNRGKDDAVGMSGPTSGSVAMSITSLSTRDVYDKDIDLVVLPGGEVVPYNESYKDKGYRINAKKGDFIPKIFFDSKNPEIKKAIMDGGYIASGTGVPVIEGKNDDGYDVAIEIPFIREGENKGSLDTGSEIYKSLVQWYRVSLSDAKKFSQDELDKFISELDKMAPKVR